MSAATTTTKLQYKEVAQSELAQPKKVAQELSIDRPVFVHQTKARAPSLMSVPITGEFSNCQQLQ